MAFADLYTKFKKTPQWALMAATRENSPWHREDSVAIHTEMVLEEFHKICFDSDFITEREYNITAVAILFHDAGKPAARKEKETEERGKYSVFSGHESVSSRLFEDFYCANESMFAGVLVREDVHKVMWIIENHLPYQVKKSEKFQAIRDALEHNLDGMETAFFNHLLSDSRGRMPDADYVKAGEVEEWCELVMSLDVSMMRDTVNKPTMYVLIGASGSGKSSFSKRLEKINCFSNKPVHYFSLDACRLEYAEKMGEAGGENQKDQYRTAYQYCDTHRSMFRHWADTEFMIKLKQYQDIIIDNTNVSRKTRAMYTTEARKRGYRVVAVMFPITLAEVLKRQGARSDKYVPDEAVTRQYMGVQVPFVGTEVDSISVCWDNLEKGPK